CRTGPNRGNSQGDKSVRLALTLAVLGSLCFLPGCKNIRPTPELSGGHIQKPSTNTAGIPQPVRAAPVLPEPQPMQVEPTHTAVVNDVPLRELLISLALDADLSLDVDSDVEGRVTLNAINQPLPAILERIAETSDLRYDIKNDVLRIRRDAPFLRNYRV